MGSAHAAYDDELPWLAPELAYLRRAVDVGTPVLGICFGGQALARVLGGTVGRAPMPERGLTTVESLDPAVPAGPWMEFHHDAFTLPPGATPLARSEAGLQAFAHGPHLGVQFHPEISPDVFAAWAESWSPADRAAVAGTGVHPSPGMTGCTLALTDFARRAVGRVDHSPPGRPTASHVLAPVDRVDLPGDER